MDRVKKMKTTSYLLFIAALLAAPVSAWAGNAAPITSVIVYGDRAQVTRSLSADCASGKARFGGLPSTLQPDTLHGSLAGAGGGKVVGLTHAPEVTGPRPEAEALLSQIRALDIKMVAAGRESTAASAQQKKLATFRAHLARVWAQQASLKKPAMASWDAGLATLRKRELAARLRARKAASSIRQLGRQRQLLSASLQQVERKRRRVTLAVEVLLKCTGKRTVDLAYTVPGASWDMRHQLRAEQGGRKVTMVALAAVRQGTGEDWSGVKLSLSTANLTRKNVPPSLQTMYVSSQKPADTRKVLTRRFEQREHLKTSDKESASLRQEPGAAAAPSATSDLAMSLPAAGRVSIPADGREVVVTLGKRTVPAKVVLETVPKLYPFIYTRVTADNPFAFPLLAGPVELFSGRSSLGKTRLKLHAPGEPVSFTLGVHNQLQVKRYVKNEKLEGAGAFGSQKKLRHRYIYDLGNWTNKGRTIRLLENIPVSRIKDVQVTLGDETTKPTSWNKEDGLLAWEVKVPARGKMKVTLDFTVKLPKEWVVQGYQ